MTRFILSALFLLSVLIITVPQAHAQERFSDMEAGLMIGEPTGLSFKMWRNNKTAIDAGLAWSFSDDGSLHIHGDYLLHNWLEVEEGSLAFYYGIGARIRVTSNSKFGARIPAGLQYLMEGSRIGFFFEIAPILNLLPDTDLDVNGGIGARYFF
ncbi:MAG TPA: hypothetical protein VKM36_10925 [Balneolaceae bacterium]|nr:hypothetical protein [Balneolaceae bacterium]